MAMDKEKAEKYWAEAQKFVDARFAHYKKMSE